MRISAGLIATVLLVARIGACDAQANADPGSALMGASKAQEHAEARAKNKAAAMEQAHKSAPTPGPSNDPKAADDHH